MSIAWLLMNNMQLRKKGVVPLGVEPRLKDLKSSVLTVTPWNCTQQSACFYCTNMPFASHYFLELRMTNSQPENTH